ncbi:hypothetical protein L226DRAFT_455888 [Lentinus tigrinus ALCF2SS1-7]|uniref:F-box domain-containing protein n=1 Tax=Lentinus tigrinus ALCF2SS1-6 TaxID=1328759 RepID=A0A5C2SVZ8_9APHY|nr:hypothetical protein L227DRAFT_560172 [Lentinus tigrinus ALCF2SS1-6]RPD79206.1 hypothetical protein L226DRAFT_455888 [Lentinus tigrinus ALCF2SS1-7]
MPHTLLSLNYDVLSNILTLISTRDAAQLALASRAAYVLAFPRFISDVSLGGIFYKPGDSAVSQLKSFCNFVLAPAPRWHGAPSARLNGLRSLEVMRDAVRVRKDGVRVVDSSAVALLSSVLEKAHDLQQLTLWGSDALFAAFPDFGLGSSPSIHTLVLGGDIAPLPALARAFPHIRNLEFVAGGGSCVPEWAFDAPDSKPEALGPWRKNLERLDAGFPIIPLSVPVRRVDLRNPIVADEDSIWCAHTFLAQTRPVVLSAAVSVPSSPEHLGALLHATAPGIKFLELTGDRCEGLREAFDWMMHDVSQGLQHISNLSLHGVSLTVTRATVSPFAPKYQSDNYTPSAPSDKPMDLAALALAVAQSAPSLRFVALDLSAVKGASSAERAWFRVHEPSLEVARKVEKISEEEGRAIVAEMKAFNRYD